MADTTAVAIYKLGLDNQQYLQAAQTQISVSNQLVAAQERVAVSEEKAGGASLLAANAMQRRIEANTAGAREERKFAEAMAFSARAAQEGRATAEQRAIFLEQETAKLNTARAAIEAKAKAQRDAAQAEREAEAAAKNLARIESEHALALKNTAAALGVDQAALIAAANAGNRNAAAMLEMMNRIVGLNKALQEGRLGLAAHAQEIDRVQQAYRGNVTVIATQEAAMRKSNTVTGLARHELINLSRQFQDIFVSLAGGQSPLRVMIEQGSQVLDVFASTKAVLGDVFRNIIAWAARAATSVVGIATVIVTVGIAAAGLALRFVDAQRDIEKSLIGIGRRAGVTVDDVNKVAEQAGKTTRLSISQARDAAIEFINTGKVYKENLQGAVDLVDKFALATGTSAAQAAKTLADAMKDPIQFAQDMTKQFGILNGAEMERVRTLVSLNKEQEALALIMGKLKPVISGIADVSSIWARAWMAITSTMSNWVDKAGKGALELIEKMVSAMKAAKEQADVLAPAWNALNPVAVARGLAGAIGKAITPSIDPAAAALGAGALSLANFSEKAKRAKEDEDAFASSLRDVDEAIKAQNTRLDEWSNKATDAVRAMFPQIGQIDDLTKKLETMNKALGDPEILAKMGGPALENLRAAAAAAELLKRQQEDSLVIQQNQVKAVREIADAYKNAAGEGKKVTVETALQLKNLDGQIKIYQQRTRAGVEAAVQEQKMTQLMIQGKSAEEAALIISKEQLLVHLQNMTTLKEQLSVAEARTGIAKINAQYEVDINTRLREGATLQQAQTEAAIKRKIAVENVNTAVTEQIHALKQQNELLEVQGTGDEARVKAAHAFENAIRQGADALHAAALEAAVLENELQKALAAGTGLGGLVFKGDPLLSGPQKTTMGTFSGIATMTEFGNQQAQAIGQMLIQQALSISGAMEGSMPPSSRESVKEQIARVEKEAADAQENAARMQIDAAASQQQAAEQQAAAAKAARAAQISALDEAVKDIVATKLLAGQSAQAVNMLIEGGAIQFGTASTRFQTQLDLYKRAGASNAQIAADIRSGVIGEGARPSELLAALDSLTDAVDSNTAAQIGLSDFYTQQGDRLLGYRGYNVQTGIRSPIGATGGTGTGAIGGGMTGGMGGVVNVGGQVAAEFQGGAGSTGPIYAEGATMTSLLGSYYVTYRMTNGQWVEVSRVPRTGATGVTFRGYAEGGVVDRPQMAMVGEAGPEAFVPLKGGAIPVRLTGNNDNKPTTVVNINAPLVNFMAEPNRDEVRESAFQAGQMLRRVAFGG